MEPCEHTPDIFHGRTRTQTAALHPPPLRYDRKLVVRAIVPPEYAHDAEGTGDTFTIRRIEYADNPVCERFTPEKPNGILEVWEILDNTNEDYCCGVLFKRRNPHTRKVEWSGFDGTREAGGESRGYVIWDIAVHSQCYGRSSTGWRKDRWPNPPEY